MMIEQIKSKFMCYYNELRAWYWERWYGLLERLEERKEYAGEPEMSRVTIGPGSHVLLKFHNAVARPVSLAGAFMKMEVVWQAQGVLTHTEAVPGVRTPDGKPEIKFKMRLDDGGELEALRSNCLMCTLIDHS